MRKDFEMTDEQHQAILEASKPVIYMVFNGVVPESPQTKANRAWEKLGQELGFDYLTVEPFKGPKFFTAETL